MNFPVCLCNTENVTLRDLCDICESVTSETTSMRTFLQSIRLYGPASASAPLHDAIELGIAVSSVARLKS